MYLARKYIFLMKPKTMSVFVNNPFSSELVSKRIFLK